jgi:hypothetical protein
LATRWKKDGVAGGTNAFNMDLFPRREGIHESRPIGVSAS